MGILPGSNLIFRDAKDEQQEGLMETIFVGQTWQVRYLKIKAYIYGTIATASGMAATAITDWTIHKFTSYSGIIDWFFAVVI
jgi:hypothetical protein